MRKQSLIWHDKVSALVLLNIKSDLCPPGMVELVDDAGRQVVLPLRDHRDVQHGVVGPRLPPEYSVFVNTGFNIHTSI